MFRGLDVAERKEVLTIICANCHRLIRLTEDHPAIVSHGICIDCVEELYGQDMARKVAADIRHLKDQDR